MPSRLKEFLHRRKLSRFKSTNLGNIPDNHFENLQYVGIIFCAEPEQDQSAVKRFSRSLKANGMDVTLLGYFDDTTEPGQQDFPYITSATLNMALIPRSDIAKQFIDRPFDVLINLDYIGYPALSFIAAASKAWFKVGPATAARAHHDLLIELREEYSTSGLLSEIRRILNLSN